MNALFQQLIFLVLIVMITQICGYLNKLTLISRKYGFHSIDSKKFSSISTNEPIFNDQTPFAVPTLPVSSLHEKVDTLNGHLKIEKPRKGLLSNNLFKRWITGLSLGAICTLWISAGNGPFTLGFLLTSLIAQYEYYSMVIATGVYPAYKTGIISSLMCFVIAAMAPGYHELVMPLSGTLMMLWFLVFMQKSASISEISTTLLGMFYLGYLPSFWVRLRSLDTFNPGYLHSMAYFFRFLNPEQWTVGVTVTWWTWTSIVFADVGAYFAGKKFGRHKLSLISKAAGAASPNKTIEGALAGFASCTMFFTLGAYLMQWPLWQITGSLYGLMIGVIALLGDLTASMMKRDAGVKDTGKIFPGHGGLLDRLDSYMFTAPAAFFFCNNILPIFQKI